MRRNGLKVVLVIAALFLSVVARIYFSASQEWKAVQAVSDNFEVQTHHLDRVIRWYFPGNPLNRKAVDRLLSLGVEAEKVNSRQALLAYDRLRGAILSIRHVTQPFARELKTANGRILELRAKEHAEIDPELTLEDARRFHAEALEKSFSSDPFWSLVVEIGFFAWLAAIFAWIFRGFDSSGVMHWRASMPWIFAMVVGFTLWILGLLKA